MVDFRGDSEDASCATHFVGVDFWPNIIARGPLGIEEGNGEEGRRVGVNFDGEVIDI